MKHEICPVEGVRRVADNVFVLTFNSPSIAEAVRPGQFVNIRPDDSTDPLLRRPFSVYRTDGLTVEVIFNTIGRGTQLLHAKRKGESLDVLGPLGTPFSNGTLEFEIAILVGGGLGVAPLPILTSFLRAAGKPVVTLLGARSSKQLAMGHLESLQVATDDGSKGYHGNVVDLARSILVSDKLSRPKIFACGPTPMLRAMGSLALEFGIPCEVSLEGPMGCGFGICQGCPVELADATTKYALMCREGPVFDVRRLGSFA